MTRRTVPCPGCRQPADFSANNRFRPFCSERCKRNDLGAWASESYRIEGEEGEADPGAGEPSAPVSSNGPPPARRH
ncbi:MAG: DNA gyrase inhibitor YacG [Burkholderiaceae bacterium]